MIAGSVERDGNFMDMENEDISDVETELFIGQPKREIKKNKRKSFMWYQIIYAGAQALL